MIPQHKIDETTKNFSVTSLLVILDLCDVLDPLDRREDVGVDGGVGAARALIGRTESYQKLIHSALLDHRVSPVVLKHRTLYLHRCAFTF